MTDPKASFPPERSGLKARALSGAAFTLSAQLFKLVLQLLSIMVLARLLVPADFGLVAMAVVFTGLALQLMEGGLSLATVQRPNLTQDQVSNLFWLNTGLGLVLAAAFILLAPFIAAFYKEPQLASIVVALSGLFIVAGCSVQHDALLRRQMRFRLLAIIDITAMTLSVTASLVVAWLGYGYWALVAAPWMLWLSKSLLRWALLGWLPHGVRWGVNTGPLLMFGAQVSAAGVLTHVAKNVMPLGLGLVAGPQMVGLFNRAHNLAALPGQQLLPPVMTVLQPSFARVSAEPERFRRALLAVMSKLALLTVFITVCMMALADWIIALLLGPGWEDAALLLRLLAVFTVVEPLAAFTATSLTASGHAGALMRWKVLSLVIIVLSAFLGAQWGAVGLVFAVALSGVLVRLPLFLLYASRYLPVNFMDFLSALLPALLCGGLTLAAMWVMQALLTLPSPLLSLVVFAPLASLMFALTCWLVKPARLQLIESWQWLLDWRRNRLGDA